MLYCTRMHVWHIEKSIGIPQSLQDEGSEVQQFDDGLDKIFEGGKREITSARSRR